MYRTAAFFRECFMGSYEVSDMLSFERLPLARRRIFI